MTTAQIFADYLGLTIENAPWAFEEHTEPDTKCGRTGYYTVTLTATSPLAPEPTPGWLEGFVKRHICGLIAEWPGKFRARAHMWSEEAKDRRYYEAIAPHPTHAAARALIAADHTLREACERASDYNKETPNV